MTANLHLPRNSPYPRFLRWYSWHVRFRYNCLAIHYLPTCWSWSVYNGRCRVVLCRRLSRIHSKYRPNMEMPYPYNCKVSEVHRIPRRPPLPLSLHWQIFLSFRNRNSGLPSIGRSRMWWIVRLPARDLIYKYRYYSFSSYLVFE